MSSITTSFHGIHPNDDHSPHQDFIVPIDTSSNMGSGEPVYPTPFDGVPAPSLPNPNNISATQSSHEERAAFSMNGVTDNASLALAFPTYNPFPHFQCPFPFAMSSSPFLSGLPTSSESALAPSPSPSCGKSPKFNHKFRGKNTKRTVTYLAKSKVFVNTRRTSRKSESKGFAVMFVRSSHPVLDNYKRTLTKRKSHVLLQKTNRISSRSKSKVLSTRFIPDVASP
jgi:hypothetical protein